MVHPHVETLYVHRPLLNADHLIDWASEQGFGSTLAPHDMHVTIAFSKRPVPWHKLNPLDDHLIVKGGERAIHPLGEKGAIVLRFEHPHLSDRWQQLLHAGASWDHDGYRPHVTLTYDGSAVPHGDIEPFAGPLVFGPEIFKPLDLGWDQKIEEIPRVVEKDYHLSGKTDHSVKYGKSITMETNRMTELSTLLMKNIDLILEAYNVDDAGSLVVANKKKVREADEVFHQYFVKSMNSMFRKLNENDPIMHSPDGMGMPAHGHDDLGIGHEMMGDMSAMGHEHEMMAHHGGHEGMMAGEDDMTGMYPHHMAAQHMGQQHMGQHMGMHPHMEGAETEDDWLSEEVGDLDINAMFDIVSEDEQVDEDSLNEFGGMQDDDDEMMSGQMGGSGGGSGGGMMGGGMGGGMDDGGANDFGGDMGGMGDAGGGDDDMGLDSALGGDDMNGGGDEDMVTIHGTTDNGGAFDFSFDPSTLGFGDEMGGDMGGGDMGGDDGHDHEAEEHGHEHHGHEQGPGHPDLPGMGADEDEDQPPFAEAAEHFHNGKPRTKKNGSKSSRMAVVPANPAARNAAPFPSPFPSGRHGR